MLQALQRARGQVEPAFDRGNTTADRDVFLLSMQKAPSSVSGFPGEDVEFDDIATVAYCIVYARACGQFLFVSGCGAFLRSLVLATKL